MAQQTKRVVIKWCIALALVLGTAVGVYYLTTHYSQVRNQLMLATSRQPEPLTELYFADPQHLPARAVVGQVIPVSFVISNKEAQDTTYVYRLYFTGAEGTKLYGSYQVDIPLNQSQTIFQNVAIPVGQGRGTLGVQLINKGQSVHFWLERDQTQ